MKTIEEYMALPYTMIVRWSADDELFVATVKEIEGCTGHGDTEADALVMLRDNLKEWIAYCLESCDPIPIPADSVELPSGKWLQRVPRSLHAALTVAAEEEGVSLNQYVVSVLARELGYRRGNRDVLNNLNASAPALADPWALFAHSVLSRWDVDSLHLNKPLDVLFMNTLLRALPKEAQSASLEIKGHGKNKENNWN
jgi:predicted HicB family RNase H-like nuclease